MCWLGTVTFLHLGLDGAKAESSAVVMTDEDQLEAAYALTHL